MDEEKNSGEPSSYRESQSFKQNYAGTFVAKRIDEQADPIYSSEQRTYPEGEILPVEIKIVLDSCLVWLRKNHNAVTAVSTLLIFAATAIYAVFAILQWRAMGEANKITREAFQTEAKAHLAMKWISWASDYKEPPSAVDQICPDDSGHSHFCIVMHFENGGKTPALETHTIVHVIKPTNALKARDIVEQFHFPALGEPEGRDPASAGQHDWPEKSVEEICDSGDCVIPQDAQSMIDGGLPILIYGVTQYRDIFKRQHATRFCFHRAAYKCPSKRPGGCLDTCPFGNWLDKDGDIPTTEQ